jgi:hypothetical protein
MLMAGHWNKEQAPPTFKDGFHNRAAGRQRANGQRWQQ